MTPTKNESLPELPEPDAYCAPYMVDNSQAFAWDGTGRKEWHAAPLYGQQKLIAYAEAALTREAPTEAVDVEALHSIVRSWEGGQSAVESMAQFAATMGQAIPPAPQRLAQGDYDLSDENIARVMSMRMGLDHTFGKLVSGGTIAIGYEKADIVRALFDALRTTQPPHQDRGEVEQRARELLAAEYERDDFRHMAQDILTGTANNHEKRALRAIVAALTEAKQQDEAARERDLLAEAIGNAGVKCGLLRPDIEGLTGPQLLMIADDMAEALKAKQQGPGEAESPSLKQTPAWWVGYPIGSTGRAPYHCIGPDMPASRYANESVHWIPLYTAPQVEAKRKTGEGHD